MIASEIRKIAALFPERWDQHYVAAKLRTDPLYSAISETLRDSERCLLDLGCGIGLSAFYLRAAGFTAPIVGLDYDSRKIQSAKQAYAASGYTDLAFYHHDARSGLPDHRGNVCILDILQFFNPDEQENLIRLAASRVDTGGKLIIRSGLQGDCWRFRITVLGDWLAKATFWMKAAPTHYPTEEGLRRLLEEFGPVEISPLWGKTPFNNFLIVMTRLPKNC